MRRIISWLKLIALVWLSVENESGPSLTVRGVGAKAVVKEGLYSSEDDVIILNNKNMRDRVYGKSMVWMIEFYNSWCGHCVKFAPTWKQFTSDLKGWRRVVSIGAVDCSTDENLKICRDFEINAYPSIKLLPPNFSDEISKSSLQKMTSQDPVDLKNALLEYLTGSDFPHPRSWPRLDHLRSLGDIWVEAKDEHKFVVVVFEEESSIVGRQVILDLVDYPSILVRTMLRKDVEKFGIIKYPSLYIINKDSSFQHLASGSGLIDQDRHTFVDKLLSLLGLMDSEGKPIKLSHGLDNGPGGQRDSVVQFEQPRVVQQPAVEQNVSRLGRTRVHMKDLESALHYTFRQEIAICKTIAGPKLDALHNFMSALAKYFPGRAKVSQFLWKVVDYLQQLDTSSDTLTGESWLNAIDDLQDSAAFLPDQVQWVSCQGSQPRYRGYPCGMWTLFHTLTVAAYKKEAAVNAQEVPLAIRDYMEYFFGCHECSQNFVKMASKVETEIHKPVEAVLWLWTAHNKANKRLHGDASEDPEHPKIQFPSTQDCPACHISGSDFDPVWNSSAVTQFLVQVYGREGIVYDAFAGMVQGGKPRQRDGEEMDWWEKKQKEADLKKIRQLRKEKRERRVENPLKKHIAAVRQKAADIVERRGGNEHGGPEGREESAFKFKGFYESWGLNQLDIGVCMVFYISCAVIILVLYYHFIVHKRHRLPCSNYCSL